MVASNASRTRITGVEVCLFLLLLLCYLWPIDLDPGANVYAHMDQAAAIVSSGTLAIDAFMRPPEGPNTVDWSRGPDGRVYPAKAPGCAFAALPLMAMLYYAESAMGIAPFEGDWFRRNIVLVNWALNALVSAVAMTLLLRIVLLTGVRLRAAVLGVLSIALGTAYFPYATTYYAHNLAANLIIIAAYLIFTAAPAPSWTREALIGLLAGFAVTFDYAAGLAVLVFAAVLAAVRPRALVPFVLGGLLPLAFLIWYHTAAFGGPAMTAYRFMNPRIAPPDGGDLLRLPRLRTLVALVFSPYRGILFYSPVLALAGVGVWRALRNAGPPVDPGSSSVPGHQKLIVLSGLALFVAWFLFNACYYIWWGGWTAGSRYIIPGLVLLAPAIAIGFAAFPRLGAILLAVSVANQLAITTVLILVNDDVVNPLAEVVYPQLWRGEFERSNLGVFVLGLSGLWSLAALLVPAAALSVLLARRVRGKE